jgi:hypothetical protein
MSEESFNELPLKRKMLIVNEFAYQLISMEYYDHRIYLYSLGCNFVELFVNIETDRIEKITIAKYGDLDKYLSQILIKKVSPKHTG